MTTNNYSLPKYPFLNCMYYTSDLASTAHLIPCPVLCTVAHLATRLQVQLKQKIGVTLDMTHRTLAFDINGKYLGVAFTDLPSGPLYPAASAVYGHSEISLVYLGAPLVG